MFDLKVSYDSGHNYGLDRSAETLDELKPRMAELDARMLRWVVEKDGKQTVEAICKIHVDLINTMIDASARDEIERSRISP